MDNKTKRGRGRPSFISGPRTLSLLVSSAQYAQLEAMLAEARLTDPKIKLSDLARQVMAHGIEARQFARTLSQFLQVHAA
jgi:hypothetical protein